MRFQLISCVRGTIVRDKTCSQQKYVKLCPESISDTFIGVSRRIRVQTRKTENLTKNLDPISIMNQNIENLLADFDLQVESYRFLGPSSSSDFYEEKNYAVKFSDFRQRRHVRVTCRKWCRRIQCSYL